MSHAPTRSHRLGAVLMLTALPLGPMAACADTNGEAYGAYINGWVGKPVAQLTADWGRPSYETEERGLRELQYIYSQAVSFGQRPIYVTCTTKFLIDDAGIVKVAEAGGNACSSKVLGPGSRGL